MLYYVLDCDAYTVEFSVGGNYDEKHYWTGGSASVSTDSDNLIITYRIGSKTMKVSTEDSRKILKLTATVDVESWIGVGDVGLIKIGTQTINTTQRWGRIEVPGTIIID